MGLKGVKRLSLVVAARRIEGRRLDALTCPRCERTMPVLATITAPGTIRGILEHLGVPSEPLTAAPARDPTWEQTVMRFDDDAA
jgi:hypothetical protein